MNNETENQTNDPGAAAQDPATAISRAAVDHVDAPLDPALSEADAQRFNAPPADNPDTSRAGARATGDDGLIDHTTPGAQTLDGGDGSSLKLGAEIPMRGVALPDLDQSNAAASDPRDVARNALQELAGVESEIGRLGGRKEELRRQIAVALAAFGPDADDQKLTTPFGSVSLNDAPRRVKITNESDVPSNFKKLVIDEKKVGDALRAGNVVKGAELTNGGDKVVRVTWPKSES